MKSALKKSVVSTSISLILASGMAAYDHVYFINDKDRPRAHQITGS